MENLSCLPYSEKTIIYVESVQQYFIRSLFDRDVMEYFDKLDLPLFDSLDIRTIKADLMVYWNVTSNLIQIDTANSITHKQN